MLGKWFNMIGMILGAAAMILGALIGEWHYAALGFAYLTAEIELYTLKGE